ncbi:MAG: FHA domain-containing protein [Burkholderiales bacterium]|nr:FHA domain-containing protein [Burkholderiales bacterium]
MSQTGYLDTEGPAPTVPGEDHAAAAEAPADAPTEAAPSGPLARIEVLDRDGRVRHALSVAAWPVAIGRAIDNDIVLDDPHVAPYHAVIEAGRGGSPRLRVLPGRNGMRWGRRRLPAGGEPVALDDPGTDAARASAAVAAVAAAAGTGAVELTAGLTRLRLRRAGDALEPERDLATTRSDHAGTLVLALLLWLWVLAGHAISLDPGSKASDWLPPLVGAPLALGAWCLLWALASKIFQHRFEFWPHVAVAVRGVLAVEVTSFALVWLSGLSGWPGFARLVTGATAAIGVVTLWAHARLVLPQQRRALAYAATAAYVAGAAILLALNQQRQERWFAELYAHTLPPPSLMWQRAVPRDAFVLRAERLRPVLDKSVAEAAAEQKEKGDDADEE